MPSRSSSRTKVMLKTHVAPAFSSSSTCGIELAMKGLLCMYSSSPSCFEPFAGRGEAAGVGVKGLMPANRYVAWRVSGFFAFWDR